MLISYGTVSKTAQGILGITIIINPRPKETQQHRLAHHTNNTNSKIKLQISPKDKQSRIISNPQLRHLPDLCRPKLHLRQITVIACQAYLLLKKVIFVE